MSEICMERDNAKRLLKDVRSIIKDGLEDQGIFYKHDEENMKKGYALIIGPQNTPYQNGFYLFDFDFPSTYPYNPPKLTFKNQYNNIRFHPNLYRNGKVCISILNTWHGEKWSSCQTIKTILLTLCMILTDNPLLHEPGIKETHDDFKTYNKIVFYANLKYNIYELVNSIFNKKYNSQFNDIIIEKIKENFKNINKLIKEKKNTEKDEILFTTIYSLNCRIDYNNLLRNMKNLASNNNICELDDNDDNKINTVVKKRGRPKKVKN